MESCNYLQVAFERVYKPLLRSVTVRVIILLVAAGAVLFVSAIGLNDMELGLSLSDMYKEDTQNWQFIHYQQQYFPVFSAKVNWGALDYTNPVAQMKMVKQWEDVAATSHVIPGLTSGIVWIAAMANWGIEEATVTAHPACKAEWHANVFNLRNTTNGGYCRQDKADNSTACAGKSGCCPVLQGMSQDQLADCIEIWSNEQNTLMKRTAPGFRLVPGTLKPVVPIMITQAGGNDLYTIELRENKDFTTMIADTRKYTDDVEESHSFMSGISFNYWEQYLSLIDFVRITGAITCAGGFVFSWTLLFLLFTVNKYGTCRQRLLSVTVGALLITLVQACSMVSVSGFAVYCGVKMTAFSAVSILLSSGFAIEYSVHIIHHFLENQAESSTDRATGCMSFLFAPTFMSVISSAIAVVPLAFSGFKFVTIYFFTPLILVVVVTYFYGVIVLPVVLSCCRFLPTLRKAGEPIKGVEAEAKTYDQIMKDAACNPQEYATPPPDIAKVPQPPRDLRFAHEPEEEMTEV